MSGGRRVHVVQMQAVGALGEAAKDGEWHDVRVFGDLVHFLHVL